MSPVTTAKALAALLTGFLLVAGCSDDGDGEGSDDATTSPTGAWEPTPGLCEVLSTGEPAQLLALQDPATLEGPERVNEGRGCVWIDRRQPEVQLLLIAIPTREWVRELPSAIDAQLALDDLSAEDRSNLETIQSELGSLSTDDTDDLCDLFSRMAEVQGYPEDSATTVYVTRGAPGLSAQHCEGDTYTTLVGRSARLSDSESMLAAYGDAVERAAAAR